MTREAPFLHARIADSERYEGLHPRFGAAFAFLRRPDLASLPTGRYEIDGDNCWAQVSEVELRPFAGPTQRTEVHARYIDIQSPLDGPETYGLYRTDALFEPFDAEKDYGLADVATEPLTLEPGSFVVFMPRYGAHAPCLTQGAAGTRRRKVVIKVRA